MLRPHLIGLDACIPVSIIILSFLYIYTVIAIVPDSLPGFSVPEVAYLG